MSKVLLTTANYKLEYAEPPGFEVDAGEPGAAGVFQPYRVTNTRTGRAEGFGAQMHDAYNFIGNAEAMIDAVTTKFSTVLTRRVQ